MNKKEDKTAFIIALDFLFIIFAAAVYQAANTLNPDTDAYWLIPTGKWILDNGCVPRINPWSYEPGLSVVVQQPVCAVLNYIAYGLQGLFSLWKLAVLENLVYLSALCYLAYTVSKDKIRSVLTVALAEGASFAVGLITTRPYQLTVAAMAVLIAELERAHRTLSFKRVFIITGLLTLWQANYQMASLYFIPCFISCYAAGMLIKRAVERKKPSRKDLKWFFLYPEWFFCSLLNPYGLNGLLYLWKSRDAMALMKDRIAEMRAPATDRAFFLFDMLVLFLFLYKLYNRRTWNIRESLLTFGSLFCSFMAIRNFWMTLLVFAVLYPQALSIRQERRAWRKEERQKHGKNGMQMIQQAQAETMKNDSLATGVSGQDAGEDTGSKPYSLQTKKDNFTYRLSKMICLVFSISAAVIFLSVCIAGDVYAGNMIEKRSDIIKEIRKLKDARIYTDFNTGAVAMFAGHKVCIDARPECYAAPITKGKDILGEWYDFEFKDTDKIPEKIMDLNYEYYLVSSSTSLCKYLEYSGNAEKITETEDMKLFRFKKEK